MLTYLSFSAAHLASQLDDSIWSVEETEERKRVKEFWLSLTPDARAGLIKLEKDAVLRKMKEQQKHTCTCSVCGRRRTAIEEELEMLYDAYYDELERYTERQTEPGGFSFFKNLGAKGGMLSVANDLMKNEGKKFLEMMERLADRRLKHTTAGGADSASQGSHPGSSASTDASEESYEDEIPPASVEATAAGALVASSGAASEEQRLEEGKRMFQMFAAKMFEQRILAAYREKVSYEKQQKLIEEEEEKERAAAMKKDTQKKKRDAKKAKRKQKAEEEAKVEREKKEREEKEKEEKAKQERERREQLKRQKQAEEDDKRRQLLAAEEEERKRREKERREQEEKERKRREKEDAERREKAAAAAREREQALQKAREKEAAAQAARDAAAAAAAAAAAQAAAEAALEEQMHSGEADEDDDNAGASKKQRKKRQRKNNKKGSGDKSDVYIPGMVKPGTMQHVSNPGAPAPTVPVAVEPKQPQILKKRPQDAAPAAGGAAEPAAVAAEPQPPGGQRGGRKWRERQQAEKPSEKFAPVQILEKPSRQTTQPASAAPLIARTSAPNPNAPVFTPPSRGKATSSAATVPVQPNPNSAAYTPPTFAYPPAPTQPPAPTSSASQYFPPRGTTAAAEPQATRRLPASSSMGNMDLSSVGNLLPSTLLPVLDGTQSSPQQDRSSLWGSSSSISRPTNVSPKIEPHARRSLAAALDESDDHPAKSLLSSLLDPADEIVAPVRRGGASVVTPKVPSVKSSGDGWGAPSAVGSSLGTPLLGPIGGDSLLGGSGLKSMFIDGDLGSFYRGSVVDSSIWGAASSPAADLSSPRGGLTSGGFGSIVSPAPIGSKPPASGK